MAIRQIGSTALGGTYLESLQTRSVEQSFSIKEDLSDVYFRDFYERSSVQFRWMAFQGGRGWQGVGAVMNRMQPYSPWEPHRAG